MAFDGTLTAEIGLSSTNQTQAIANGTPVFAKGKLGEALKLRGDYHVKLPLRPGLDRSVRTISVWINLDGLPDKDDMKIALRDTDKSETTSRIWQLTVLPDGFVRFLGTPNGRKTWELSVQSKMALTLKEWHHIAVAINRTNVCLYVDGELAGDNLSNGFDVGTGDAPYEIGGTSHGNHPSGTTWGFRGRIDSLRLYESTLTPGLIKELYRADQN